MNKRHKWYNEIIAWADGAEIEFRVSDSNHAYVWIKCEYPSWETTYHEYRIKPQQQQCSCCGQRLTDVPKKPQYLYVYRMAGEHGQQEFRLWDEKTPAATYIGKIKLEVDDE